MSSRVGRKQSARQAREVRARQARRRRAKVAALAAVATLLVAGLAGVLVWQAGRPANAAVPTGATTDGTGLSVGTGPVTVELYLDYLCPSCKRFDEAAGSTLDEYVASGRITLVYRPIAILDRLSTTAFSTRAAGAAGCAADAGRVHEFTAAMMDNQPPERTAGLSDDEIVAIGAGVGLSESSFGQCVRDGRYRDWAGTNTEAGARRGVQGTPTVYVAGQLLPEPTLERLTAAVDAAG